MAAVKAAVGAAPVAAPVARRPGRSAVLQLSVDVSDPLAGGDAKFVRSLRGKLPARQADAVLALCGDPARLDATPVQRFMDLFVV